MVEPHFLERVVARLEMAMITFALNVLAAVECGSPRRSRKNSSSVPAHSASWPFVRPVPSLPQRKLLLLDDLSRSPGKDRRFDLHCAIELDGTPMRPAIPSTPSRGSGSPRRLRGVYAVARERMHAWTAIGVTFDTEPFSPAFNSSVDQPARRHDRREEIDH